MKYFSPHYSNRGFTLLYSALISSLLLAIGIAVFNINSKELLLSSTARDSQFAFYAADTGIECALFWDFQKESAFATTTTSTITCNGVDIDGMGGREEGKDDPEYSEFTLDFSPKQPYCAIVRVTKDSSGGTRIESRGYNTCDTSNPRRVERAIRTTY